MSTKGSVSGGVVVGGEGGLFQEQEEGPAVVHCADFNPRMLQVHTACFGTAETQPVPPTDRKSDKDACCFKSFILAQGKIHKTAFVHAKQCLASVACLLPVSSSDSTSARHSNTFTVHATQTG